MNNRQANLLMLVPPLIWGVAFVYQKTGMETIGPFTFSFARFFFALLTVLPLAILFEKKNFNKIFSSKRYTYLCLITGFFLFCGMGLQQYALQISLVSNVAFLSTLYVPIVAIISKFFFKKKLHWVIWVAILLCLYGSYLLSSNQSIEIQKSDSLLFIAALSFALHIIFIDIFMKELNSPFIFGSVQYFIVFLFSLVIAFMFENPDLKNIRIEWFEILFTGIISAGIGYTLQIIAQQKANPAPAAIILSMESVFAAIAGWYMLNEFLDQNQIYGCIAIFAGVVIVQIIPTMIKSK